MKNNKYVILSAFAASLGGLLFGFETAVISGAEKTIQQVYNLITNSVTMAGLVWLKVWNFLVVDEKDSIAQFK